MCSPDDRSAIKRLQFIAGSCPSLAPQALGRALHYTLEGKDTTLYHNVLAQYNSVADPQEIKELDAEWVEKTSTKAQAEKDKLEVELKMYTGNMIKESIRVSLVVQWFALTNLNC
jgi:COP9 signalosome complex subunit 1